jgi:predicted ATPase
VGKTRLALEVLDRLDERFPDGVWFVDLTTVTERRSIASAIAHVLGVRQVPGVEPEAATAAQCRSTRGLLVLDNCEHVLAAVAGVVHRLLVSTGAMRLLATSREPLGVSGEVLLPLDPLPTARPGERDIVRIAGTDAVRLYADRAAAMDPAFHINERNAGAVASLCRHLDGLPLAIELAAGQAAVLGPAQIEARLADQRTILHSHDPTGLDRHRTMTALIDCSTERLAPAERTIFQRLAVLRGSMSLEAIEAVAGDDDIARSDVLGALIRLVRCSLVIAEGTGEARRYRLLETVRQHGLDGLAASGDLERRRDRHRDWALAWAAEVASGLRGDEQASSLDVLEDDYDNVEAALEWSAADPQRAAQACDAIQALYQFWLARGTRRTQGVHLSMAIAEAALGVPSARRVRAMAQANVIIGQSDLAAAGEIAATARRVAATTPDDERAALYAAIATCWTDVATGAPTDHAALAAPSAQRPDDPDRIWIDAILSSCLATTGDLHGGRAFIRRVVEHPRLLHDRHQRGSFMSFAVDIDAAIGDHLDEARADAREALAIATDLACASCAAQALVSLLLVDHCDDLGGPVAAARRSLHLAHGINETMGVIRALDMLVVAFADEDRPADAVRVAAATTTLRRRTGYAEHEPGRRAHRHDGLSRARAALPTGAFETGWDAGRRLEYQHLVDELLDPAAPTSRS